MTKTKWWNAIYSIRYWQGLGEESAAVGQVDAIRSGEVVATNDDHLADDAGGCLLDGSRQRGQDGPEKPPPSSTFFGPTVGAWSSS